MYVVFVALALVFFVNIFTLDEIILAQQVTLIREFRDCFTVW